MNEVNHLDKKVKKWFAVYTKYKCEKFVREQLIKEQIECYVPLLKKTKVYATKIKEYEIPLVNCYIFVLIDKLEYIKVLSTQHVIKFIKVGQNLISIPEEEINLLKRVVGEYEVRLSDVNEIGLGDKVEVIGGELTGLQGHLMEIKNKNEFVIELTTIGLQLIIQIDKALIRAA